MERKNNEKEQAAYQTCRKYSNFQRKGKLSFPIRHFVSGSCKTNGKISPVPWSHGNPIFLLKRNRHFILPSPIPSGWTTSIWWKRIFSNGSEKTTTGKVHRYTLRCGPGENRTPSGILSCPCKQPAGKEEKIYSVPLSEEERNSIDKWTGFYISDNNTRSLFTKWWKPPQQKGKEKSGPAGIPVPSAVTLSLPA